MTANSPSRETIPAILAKTVTDQAQAAALLRIGHGSLDGLSWREVAGQVEALAAGLASLGVEPGDRVAHLSENRWEWVVTDLALHVARAVHVPIHVLLTAEQIAYQVRHSGAKVLVVSRADLVRDVLPRCEGVRAAVLYEPEEPAAGSIEGPAWVSLAALVNAFSETSSGQFIERAAEATQPDDLATILYTSGTTGEPKGVMLSQRNLATNSVATCQALGKLDHELRLCFLPLSHIYARTCDLYTWMARGSQLVIARSRETVIDDCRLVRPTLINGVPYFYQKLVDRLTAEGKADEPGALAKLLGGSIVHCFCGGAALPAPVAEFFERQRVSLLPGYGLTESSPVISFSRPGQGVRGTVGPPIEDVEVRIAEDGEVLTRGPHVMLGYWKDEAATAAAIRDGWLHTGDLGELDAKGYLRIRGRKKEIIVLSTGKNVSPALVEGLLTSSPLIEQAVVVGDDRKCIAALIVPNPDALRAEIIQRKIPVTSPAEALAHEQVHALYEQEIARVLAPIAEYERVQRFKLLGRGLSVERGELTAKLSLRRDVISANFRDEIDGLYAAS